MTKSGVDRMVTEIEQMINKKGSYHEHWLQCYRSKAEKDLKIRRQKKQGK